MPHLQYCSCLWSHKSKTNVDKLFKMQKRATQIIAGSRWDVESTACIDSLKWTPLPDIFIDNDQIVLWYKCINNLYPVYLCKKLSNFNKQMSVPLDKVQIAYSDHQIATLKHIKSFFCVVPKMWNKLTNKARQCKSVNSFKTHHCIRFNSHVTCPHFCGFVSLI